MNQNVNLEVYLIISNLILKIVHEFFNDKYPINQAFASVHGSWRLMGLYSSQFSELVPILPCLDCFSSRLLPSNRSRIWLSHQPFSRPVTAFLLTDVPARVIGLSADGIFFIFSLKIKGERDKVMVQLSRSLKDPFNDCAHRHTSTHAYPGKEFGYVSTMLREPYGRNSAHYLVTLMMCSTRFVWTIVGSVSSNTKLKQL